MVRNLQLRVAACASTPFSSADNSAPGDNKGAEVVLLVDTFNRYFEPENARAALAVLSAAGYRTAFIGKSTMGGLESWLRERGAAPGPRRG